jgi:hypothetical protein
MKRLVCFLVVFCLTWPALAGGVNQDRLSSKEIADGWILLFDGETTFGWTVEGSEAKVKDGVLVVTAENPTRLLTTSEFGPGETQGEFRWKGKSQPIPVVQGRGKDVLDKSESAGAWITWLASSGPNRNEATFRIGDKGWGAASPLISTRGRYGFEVPAGTTLEIRALKFKPLDLKPVFNGKDLTGWKEFPGQKSKFSVTKEGWLNVKDGRGDLQTVDKWADFTLQLECISNGDFLNSGIFFRCQPDKYQQGYEAQIHNKFLKEPKTYVLEEFDPKTHQSLGKRKAQYLADDYGTGAIYRRIPARRQASKDREWFTMSVIAEGRHIAVWVNGVQVTDWTDNRPANDNGRNGYRAEAGPISIQGHDPTTDLSFRNLRIAELPKAK